MKETVVEIRKGDDLPGGALTSRERWNRVMHYQQVDYVSNMEFGYWDELKEEWMAQGHLPESMRQPDGSIPNRLVEEFLVLNSSKVSIHELGPCRSANPSKSNPAKTSMSIVTGWACW